jgi:asparagine synthase (glutamine-hydrolysing)
MCGIAGVVGENVNESKLTSMLNKQAHRGPDSTGRVVNGNCILGHNRLSIIDLSAEGNQPMVSICGRYFIVFNGELYNYKELRNELSLINFRSQSDTEVFLQAYIEWGVSFLDKCIGMFAFAIWDSVEHKLFAARDRFGVKPLYYSFTNGLFYFASEIKSLWEAGVKREPKPSVWASYFAYGSYGMPDETFYSSVNQLPAGHFLYYSVNKGLQIKRWYDFQSEILKINLSPDEEVEKKCIQLLKESVSLRFRSDVPVGFNLSGGLDSSLLLSVVDSLGDESKSIKAFTFTSGHPQYDELPWVKALLHNRQHPLVDCRLDVLQVPELTAKVSYFQDEPFGGIPTLAYAQIFEEARKLGVLVLLDGQGIDETWGGYDYYAKGTNYFVQGTTSSPTRPEILLPEFLMETTSPEYPSLFDNKLQNLQYRDIFYTKIPRALRFNDRISMMFSTELREPFLDHRLVEFGFAQSDQIKMRWGEQKWLIRKIAQQFIGQELSFAPKRPVQTPQREWLRTELREWASERIALFSKHSWVDRKKIEREWNAYLAHSCDNSFYIWQWINASYLLN